jgi:hypothetical protein
MGKQSCLIETRSLINTEAEPTECSDSTAQFYVQVFCYLTQEELDQRYFINEILTFEVLLINVIFLIFVHKVNKRLKEKYTEWDHKTTTISDYTVKYHLPDKLYERFVDYVYDMNEGEFSTESRIYAFKKFLKGEITKMLKEEDSVEQDDDGLLGIVDIQFTFRHYRLIPLMMQRGRALWDQDREKRIEIENKVMYDYSSKLHCLY